MQDSRLPVVVSPFGPHQSLAFRVFNATARGGHLEALAIADEAEGIAAALGDERTARSARLARTYALTALNRLAEALAVGEPLARAAADSGPRTQEAKILADVAEVLVKLGRLDEGLHALARALALLDVAPRSSTRYVAAMSSVCEAARAADLYELADEALGGAITRAAGDQDYHSAADLQHAELLMEWGMRLDQIGETAEAAERFARGLALVRPWITVFPESKLTVVLYALGLARTGASAEALAITDPVLPPLRAEGAHHEARLAHLARGIARGDLGDLAGARRELVAADELADRPGQRLIFQFELARLAARAAPGETARIMLGALETQMAYLWRLRLDRRLMLRLSRRRAELERARAQADRAASSDALTGLGNRRLFDRRIDDLDDAGGEATALLLVDVDVFKGINDTYSHGVGDSVLRSVADVLRAHCRQGEAAIRFGGDEFAVFLHADLRRASVIAERIGRVIAARDWDATAPGLRVTLSMGLAAFEPGMTGRDLYDRADSRLYEAKRRGRNRLAA
ncbi:GGDEF domain-containing protein [Catenuloplanes japonicus]|uniref:GGDEF domain-containing protein n=1 Tax=Catenuloplanes japonicus TaxID=33876 RepID=UPI000A1025E8|nr:GGDEF domain-containing protein [Catenuloplanes japonicus]